MKKILTAALFFAAALFSSAAANAERNYIFPYEPNTGFSVPCTAVSHEELSEPEYLPGEIYQQLERPGLTELFSYAKCILPNGITIADCKTLKI